jgi:hypothetical protein
MALRTKEKQEHEIPGSHGNSVLDARGSVQSPNLNGRTNKPGDFISLDGYGAVCVRELGPGVCTMIMFGCGDTALGGFYDCR